MQTKGSTNRIFRLASLLQVTKSASGCISKKSIGTGMTKSASGDEIKCLTGTKETMSMETATLTVTTARDKAVAMTGLSINFYPIQKKRASFLSLPSSISFPFLILYKEKSWDSFWRNRNVGPSFPFWSSGNHQTWQNPKILDFPTESETYTFMSLSSLQICTFEYRSPTFRTCRIHNHRYSIQFIYRPQNYHNIHFITMEERNPCGIRLRNNSNFLSQ